MGGIEVYPERRPVVDRLERLAGRDEVVSDLGRVHLEPEPHPLLLEDVEDRPPALSEILVPTLNHDEVVRREGVEEVPDGEPVNPLTCSTPIAAAALAVSAMRAAARCRTPSGSPSP